MSYKFKVYGDSIKGGSVVLTTGDLLYNTATYLKTGPLSLYIYTGLRDKDDVCIYEGDIVRFTYSPANSRGLTRTIVAKVELDRGCYGVHIHTSSGSMFRTFGLNEALVIGHIHEHDYLLEKTDERT